MANVGWERREQVKIQPGIGTRTLESETDKTETESRDHTSQIGGPQMIKENRGLI